MTARRGLALTGVALAATLVAGRVLAGAYAEWAWYHALGAGSVWTARIEALTALRLGLFGVAFLFAFGNLLVMRRSIISLVLPRQLGNLLIGEAVPGSTLTGVAVMLSVMIAAAVALPQADWLVLLRAYWATPLGEIDPYLGRDMAFWMGWLPLERSMQAWSVMLAVVVGATVLLLYVLTPSVRVDSGRMHVSTRARRHFAVYTAILLLLVAWGFRLDAFDLLIRGSGVREAFLAFDHMLLYPYLIALSIGTAAVALLVAWTGWVGQQRATLGALLLVLVAGPVGRAVLPLFDRQAAGDRDRIALDRPYLRVRALYTRRAFRLDEIARGASADSVRVDAARLGVSVAGWDPAMLASALADEPGVVPVEGAASWRVADDGNLRAVVLLRTATSDAARAPLVLREADPADADERGAPWPVTDAPAVAVPPLSVGLGLAPILPVVDTIGHVAAPAFFAGWRRIALAWSVRSLRLVGNDSADRRTKLLVRRDVRERVHTLLPFFTAGTTTQSMVVGDSLWWVVELFNASADYPLSEPVVLGDAAVHHASPAGVALVNAHSGRVRVVLPETPDQVTRWWRDRLPELFLQRRAVAPELLAALPPPVDRATVQGSALARVGFQGDTLAIRPLFQVDDADLDLPPGAALAPFVAGTGVGASRLAWGAPVVDSLDRVRGVFVAVGGASPSTVLVDAPDSLSWSGMLNRLQHAADSANLGRSRRHPRRGHVQVIPATDGLHVVQSFYDWAPERAPALSGVVTMQGERTRVGRSLVVATGGAGHPVAGDDVLRLRIARLYAEMQDALRRSDWVAFGRALEALGRLARRP